MLLGYDQTPVNTTSTASLIITDSGNNNRAMLMIDGGDILAFTYASSAYTQRGNTHSTDITGKKYLRITRVGSDVSFYFSVNGFNWKLIATQSFSFTVANIGFRLGYNNSVDGYVFVDWLRTDV